MRPLILASASPRRAQLLSQLGLDCLVCPQDIDETRLRRESPANYVERLAREKAYAAKDLLDEHASVILAADTVVSLGEDIFEKPNCASDVAATLVRLSGATHTVRSAIFVLASDEAGRVTEVGGRVSLTRVTFATISADTASRYWESGEPLGKAGGYAIQGLGAQFVRAIEGSYSGVMGLPLFETAELLGLAGIACLPLSARQPDERER